MSVETKTKEINQGDVDEVFAMLKKLKDLQSPEAKVQAVNSLISHMQGIRNL